MSTQRRKLPQSILRTWRYLIYPGVSRGMRKNIVVVVLADASQVRLQNPSASFPQDVQPGNCFTGYPSAS